MAHAFTKTLDLNNLNSELLYDIGNVYATENISFFKSNKLLTKATQFY